MFQPYIELVTDGNGIVRSKLIVDGLSVRPNEVEVWYTDKDGVPNFTSFVTTGQGKFADGSLSAPSITFANDTNTGMYRSGEANVVWVANGTAALGFNSSTLHIYHNTNGLINFGNNSANDPQLRRDDNHTLAIRNSTNPHILRIYNTFTDASNYERANLRWGSNTFAIDTSAAGTGTGRVFQLPSAVST